MKITISKVLQNGLYLEEEAKPAELDLETDLIKFRCPLKLKAQVHLVSNVLFVELNIKTVIFSICSRCLDEFEWELDKDVQFQLPLEDSDIFVDLDPVIREEIILDYPIKPLCRVDCRGLCLKCGKNKNEGGCNCGST